MKQHRLESKAHGKPNEHEAKEEKNSETIIILEIVSIISHQPSLSSLRA